MLLAVLMNSASHSSNAVQRASMNSGFAPRDAFDTDRHRAKKLSYLSHCRITLVRHVLHVVRSDLWTILLCIPSSRQVTSGPRWYNHLQYLSLTRIWPLEDTKCKGVRQYPILYYNVISYFVNTNCDGNLMPFPYKHLILPFPKIGMLMFSYGEREYEPSWWLLQALV